MINYNEDISDISAALIKTETNGRATLNLISHKSLVQARVGLSCKKSHLNS